MCGIFGIISAFNTPRSTFAMPRADDVLRDGMIVTSLRGMDSTGVFQIQESLKPFLYKKAIPAGMFVEDDIAKSYFSTMNKSMVTVAHCRAATHGVISTKNAHPFEVHYDDKNGKGHTLIGVHNGSLYGWKDEKGAKGFDVDSEYALSMIAKNGPEFLKKDIPSGAYSFVWWDSAAPALVHFARNPDRPMWLVRSKDKHHIVFASEPMMIAMILDRRGISDKFEDTVFSTNPHTHYVVDAQQKELEIAEVSRWEAPKSTAVPYSYYSRSGDWDARQTASFFAKIDGIVQEYETLGEYDLLGNEITEGQVFMPSDFLPLLPEKDDEPAPTTFPLPCESNEIGTVPDSELYIDSVNDKQREEADNRGLYGEVVVFSSAGTKDESSITGSILCLTGPNYNSSRPVKARLIWPGPLSGETTPVAFGKKKFAAIVGVEQLALGDERFILSPLKAGGAVIIGKEAQDWRDENCPNVAIGL